MASIARSRIPAFRPAKPGTRVSVQKAEKDLLDSVMVSVSASLENLSDKERERAVKAAEKAVSHLH